MDISDTTVPKSLESVPAGATAAPVRRPAVPALYKAFAILDLLARQGKCSFTVIQRELGLPKSSAHQLIAALCDLGALQTDPSGGYLLGLHLCELGAIATSQRSIEQTALPFLRRLALEVNMTCHLGILEGGEAVYLAKVEGEQEIRINTWVGKRLSLSRSALGKALLAWQPEGERQRLIAGIDWVAKTVHSITDAATLQRGLEETRARGWATDDEEDGPNIRCVAAPIFDRDQNVIAALSVVSTVLQVQTSDIPRIGARVCTVAAEISRALGSR